MSTPPPTKHFESPLIPSGPLAYMAQNGVAANLLMVAMLVSGLLAYGRIVQEVFSESSLDTVQVSVVYPGATPAEVEEAIVVKIEEVVESIEGVDRVKSTAREGVGTVSIELQTGTDLARALDDIKGEVDQIQTFPDQAEEPSVRELTTRQNVIKIALYGDVSEEALKETAYRAEDELAALDAVTYVETSSVRAYEISIEVSQQALQAYGLTLPDIAGVLATSSLDLPAGSIDTRAEQVRIRTLGQSYTQQDFENIVLVSQANGATVRLGQVATVRDGFEDTDLVSRYDGHRAAFVEVFRTSDERVLEVSEAVNQYLESELRPSLPAGIEMAVWNDDAELLDARLGLLLKNAAMGLLLVFLALTFFLDLRLAIWSAIGIGVSFVGTVALMHLLGASINMMSLFGFLLAIGIVVDDAIVVGENIYSERAKGAPGLQAAINGVRRVATPVTFAVLTTMCAFSPLFFVGGVIGSTLGDIPLVVTCVLALSLVESLFVLPNHLSHLPPPIAPTKGRIARFFERIQGGVDRQLKRFVEGPLERSVRFAVGAPGLVLMTAVGLIVISVALIPAGILRVSVFPGVPGETIAATLEMPVGTPVEQTEAAAARIEAVAQEVIAELEATRPDDAVPLVKGLYSVVGQLGASLGPTGAQAPSGSHLASVQLALSSADVREIDTPIIEAAWREGVGTVQGAETLSYGSDLFSIGAPVSVALTHPDPERSEAAAQLLMDELRGFQGVFDIESDADAGLREIQLRLKPEARTLGVTLNDVARQVRAAFFGAEALRVQRGREDVRVYVRLTEEERNAIADVERFRVRVPGGEVSLSAVAEVSFGTAPAVVRREDGQRVVTVTGDLDEEIVTSTEVRRTLEAEVLPQIAQQFPELRYDFGGEQEEQAESLATLGLGFFIALLGIYVLLAIPFKSYVQPLIITAAIPFGIIGAFIGHLVLDLPIGVLSIFGIIGLSGVVINDALVMIDFINERLREGDPIDEAIVAGAKARFRPILLTTVTTFLGVAPITFENDLQAQFLIPMAASLSFGIVFATVILMLVVPALTHLQHRAQERIQRALDTTPADVTA
ncbi:MAG: efflux RND transporter permease subunit [Bacteroidota bacterium]